MVNVLVKIMHTAAEQALKDAVDEEDEEDEVAMLGEEDAPVPRQIAVVEHCMMVTGEERLRVKITLSVAGRGIVCAHEHGMASPSM